MKFFLFLCLFFCILFQTLNLQAMEPKLKILEQAALKYAGVDPQETVKWKSRAAWAAALPKITVGIDQTFVNQINNTVRDSVAVSSSGVTLGPPESSVNEDNNFNQGFIFRATWSFDKLAFSQDALAISSEARARTVIRSQILERLHKAYFERKKILLKEAPKTLLEFSPATKLHLEELDSTLDSLTGGAFSKNQEEGVQNEK